MNYVVTRLISHIQLNCIQQSSWRPCIVLAVAPPPSPNDSSDGHDLDVSRSVAIVISEISHAMNGLVTELLLNMKRCVITVASKYSLQALLARSLFIIRHRKNCTLIVSLGNLSRLGTRIPTAFVILHRIFDYSSYYYDCCWYKGTSYSMIHTPTWTCAWFCWDVDMKVPM